MPCVMTWLTMANDVAHEIMSLSTWCFFWLPVPLLLKSTLMLSIATADLIRKNQLQCVIEYWYKWRVSHRKLYIEVETVFHIKTTNQPNTVPVPKLPRVTAIHEHTMNLKISNYLFSCLFKCYKTSYYRRLLLWFDFCISLYLSRKSWFACFSSSLMEFVKIVCFKY